MQRMTATNANSSAAIQSNAPARPRKRRISSHLPWAHPRKNRRRPPFIRRAAMWFLYPVGKIGEPLAAGSGALLRRGDADARDHGRALVRWSFGRESEARLYKYETS